MCRLVLSAVIVAADAIVPDVDSISTNLTYGTGYQTTVDVDGTAGTEVRTSVQFSQQSNRRLGQQPEKFRGGLPSQTSDSVRFVVKPYPTAREELERHFHRRLQEGGASVSRVFLPTAGWYAYQVPKDEVASWKKELKPYAQRIENDALVYKTPVYPGNQSLPKNVPATDAQYANAQQYFNF